MEIILIILTGAVISALCLGCFFLGMRVESKKEHRPVATLDTATKEAIKESLNWIRY